VSALEYKNPPVNELIMGVYFSQPLLGMRAEHVGVFWKVLGKSFPEIEQQPPIKDVYIPAPNEQFPLPRYWLKSPEGAYLVQLQRNAFILNWRSDAGGKYPHYEGVKELFDQTYLKFADFIVSELGLPPLAIQVCELAYVNLVERTNNWSSIDQIPELIPSFKPLDPKVPSAVLVGVNIANIFRIDDELSLAVHVRTVRRDDAEALVFEQRASGSIGEGTKSAADKWFERAHEVTGACFQGLTSRKFQTEVWEIKEG
jgi:uncharacterized protein (TIGR04255 family)